jgi:hypothetical protein
MVFGVSSGSTEAFHIGLVLTAFGFGFRHGIDWDHIAALTDITSSQSNPKRSMRFATLYAVGHGLVVFTLGFFAIVFARQLPPSIDATMERVVGATLIVLGVYVVYSLIHDGRDFRMRSRWMLLFAGVRRCIRFVRNHDAPALVEVVHEHDHSESSAHHFAHEHLAAEAPGGGDVAVRVAHRHAHRHVGTLPPDPFVTYGSRSAFGVGMLHGIGAETPTQLLIFLAVAGAGGKGAGVLLLLCFLVGLLSSNTLVALAGTFGFLGAANNFRLYAAVSVVTAAFSLCIGTLFVFGQGTVLPVLFGG